jgi:hypothetical protein
LRAKKIHYVITEREGMVPSLTTLERLMGSSRLYWAILDWDKVVSLETCFRKYMISWGS